MEAIQSVLTTMLTASASYQDRLSMTTTYEMLQLATYRYSYHMGQDLGKDNAN